VAAGKSSVYCATKNQGLQELLLGELSQDTLVITGGRTLPVLPMPGETSAGWLLAMGILYRRNPSLSISPPSLSLVRGLSYSFELWSASCQCNSAAAPLVPYLCRRMRLSKCCEWHTSTNWIVC
jgi:hypothetical protein